MLHLPLAVLLLSAAATGDAAPGAALATPSAGPDAHAEAMRAAAAAFDQRDDPARLREAIARFDDAASLRATDPAPWLALARAHAFRAEVSPAEARDAWREASRAAERALRLVQPAFGDAVARGEPVAAAAGRVEAAGAEPLYWLALATMGMARSRGMAAVLAVQEDARAMMARAAALDERIDHGGPRRELGAWIATVPSAAGGGAAAARIELERARSLDPRYQLTRVRDAAVLAVLLQDRARFEALLREVQAFDVAAAPEIAPENRLARRLAGELLAREDRLF